ncbi:unnamed protein product, partial [Rotaria socialis]
PAGASTKGHVPPEPINPLKVVPRFKLVYHAKMVLTIRTLDSRTASLVLLGTTVQLGQALHNLALQELINQLWVP